MATYSYQTRQALEKRLGELVEDYQAVQNRLGRVIDPVEGERLRRQAEDLENELREIECLLKLVDDFDAEKIRGLCSTLDINFENIRGQTRIDIAYELMKYAKKQDRLWELIQIVLWGRLGKRQALIIYSTDYADRRLSNFPRSDVDADTLKQLLDNPEIGYFDSTILLHNPPRHDVESVIRELCADSTIQDVLLLYIVGYSIVEEAGDLYLATADTDLDRLNETAVSAQYIISELERSLSLQKILVLDCANISCSRSETNVTKNAVDTIWFPEHNWRHFSILKGEGHFHYIQSGKEIVAVASFTPFTQRLINALASGEADRDQNGIITIYELNSYISKYQPVSWSVPGPTEYLTVIAKRTRKPLFTYDANNNLISHQPPDPNETPVFTYNTNSNLISHQTRMLDAAIAREVVLGIPTELVAQVRLKNSPGLKGILELDIDYDPQPEDVKSRSIQLEFPLDERQKPQGIFLLLKVSSHDFKPPAQAKKIIVPPDADSEPCIFQLIPLRVGQLGILLEVYDTGQIVTTSTKIRVNCQENQAAVLDPGNRILISLPLSTTVRPFSETEQEALQKRLEELIEDYKAVMVQIGYESNSSSKLKLERQASAIADEIKKLEQQLREENALPANIGEHHEVIDLLRQAIMALENGEFDRANYHLQELQTSWANPQISRLRSKVVKNERQFYYLLRRGAAAHEANDYQEAIHSLQAALSIKPYNTEAQARLAHIRRYYELLLNEGKEALIRGFYQDAVHYFEIALSIKSGDPEVQTALNFAVLMRDGKNALEVQNYRQAMGMLHQAISIKPDHEDALALLAKINAQFEPLLAEGQSSLEANDFRQAFEKLSQALSIRPDHQEARADLEFAWLLVDGEEALESKEYKRAVNIFEQALSIKPYHRETHINQRFASLLADGEIALEANNYQQAVANFDQALSLKPDHQVAKTDLRFALLLVKSQTALEAEEYRHAIYQLNEALSIKPGHEYTLGMLSKVDDLINSLLVEAQTALITMNYQQAIEKFDQVLSVKPDHQEAQNDQQFASLLFQSQKALEDEDYRQAIYLLNEASSIKPDHEYAVAVLARVNDRFDSLVGEAQTALEAKDYQQAVDRFNRAITIKPDHQEVQDSLRLALSNLDRSREKRTHMLALVDRLIAAGDFHRAIQLCKDTIELNPDDIEFVLRVRRAEDGLARQARWRRNLFLLLGGTVIFLIIVISIFLIARGIGQ